MESPFAMQVRYCLVNKKPVYPSPPSHTFFQAPVQKGATPRGGCHPSQLAAAQRAAAVFVLSTRPGRCQVQPPQGWFVGSGGGHGCLWWIYLQLFNRLTYKWSSLHGPDMPRQNDGILWEVGQHI